MNLRKTLSFLSFAMLVTGVSLVFAQRPALPRPAQSGVQVQLQRVGGTTLQPSQPGQRAGWQNNDQTATRPPAAGGAANESLDDSKVVLTENDFTYLGAYRIPRDPMPGEQSIYGNGLTLRRESTDSTNSVHLLSAAYGSNPNHTVYEWRDSTPVDGSPNAYDHNNYPLATVVKTYGDIYSGKKLFIYNGGEGPMTGQLDGDYGLHWDEEDKRLYWGYGFGYSHDQNSWCVGYSKLNYAENTGTGFGPWRFTDQSWKAMMGGFVAIPQSFADQHLGGKRLAIGMGGYYSIVASADCSLGPSLTAFDPIVAPEKTNLSSTPLVGYWPYQASPGVGTGHANRPEPRLSSSYDVDNWGVDKFSWNDRVRGGCWVETATKRGVLFVGHYGRDYTQYLSSQIPSSKHGHYWAIYDPNQFTPVSGTARYDVQPASIYNMQFPTIDYSQIFYAGGVQKPVALIASTNGAAVSSNTGCVVHCTAHGYPEQGYVEIRGAGLAEFNGIWEIPPGGVIDANSFYIRNTSTSLQWSGSSPSGSMTVQQVVNYVDRPLGVTFDPVTNKLYVAVSVFSGVNNLGGHVMVHVYQVDGPPVEDPEPESILTTELTAGPDRDDNGVIDETIPVRSDAASEFTMTVRFASPGTTDAQITDTIPREWQVVSVVPENPADLVEIFPNSTVAVVLPNQKTTYRWYPAHDAGTATVTIRTRASKRSFYDPYRPGTYPLNVGAKALDSNGQPILDQSGNPLIGPTLTIEAH